MASESQRPAVSDAINIVMLGDALGNDEQLSAALPQICTNIGDDASGSGSWKTIEFLRRVWSDYVSANLGQFAATVSWAVECFTQAESKRIIAISEAKLNNAKANKINAEATAIRAHERRRDELLEYFTARSIDMAAEEQEGILRIVFVKPDAERPLG